MFLALFVSALCLSRSVTARHLVAATSLPSKLLLQDQLNPIIAAAARSIITNGPQIDDRLILARQAIKTCGYISGNGGELATLPPVFSP